ATGLPTSHIPTSADLTRGEGGAVAQDLILAGQVLPVGHVDQSAAGVGQSVELSGVLHDARLVEGRQLHAPLDYVGVENLRDDHVRDLGGHVDSSCYFTPASAFRRAARAGFSRMIRPC